MGTGVFHSQLHLHKDCPGQILYNGSYWCDICGTTINPSSHPSVYVGYLRINYPGESYEDHPNFNQEMYRDGVVEIESFATRRL
jgi:hypothetical protein